MDLELTTTFSSCARPRSERGPSRAAVARAGLSRRTRRRWRAVDPGRRARLARRRNRRGRSLRRAWTVPAGRADRPPRGADDPGRHGAGGTRCERVRRPLDRPHRGRRAAADARAARARRRLVGVPVRDGGPPGRRRRDPARREDRRASRGRGRAAGGRGRE